jgi:hypothetical protein
MSPVFLGMNANASVWMTCVCAFSITMSCATRRDAGSSSCSLFTSSLILSSACCSFSAAPPSIAVAEAAGDEYDGAGGAENEGQGTATTNTACD